MIRIDSLTKTILSVTLFFLLSYIIFESLFDTSRRIENSIIHLEQGWLAAITIYTLLILDILIPIPSSLVIILSGSLFGGFLGGVITLFGMLTSTTINFIVSRNIGKRILKKDKIAQLKKLNGYQGELLVLVTRMIPLATESISSLAGISGMKLKKFVMLNIFGLIPINFFYSYLGGSFKENPLLLIVGLVIGTLVPTAVYMLAIRRPS